MSEKRTPEDRIIYAAEALVRECSFKVPSIPDIEAQISRLDTAIKNWRDGLLPPNN